MPIGAPSNPWSYDLLRCSQHLERFSPQPRSQLSSYRSCFWRPGTSSQAPLDPLPRSHQFPAACWNLTTRDGISMTANIIGVVPEYEWRISTPNQLTRSIQKVYNFSLNMWVVEENKVCEANDVTARRLDPLNPPIPSHIFERSLVFPCPI